MCKTVILEYSTGYLRSDLRQPNFAFVSWVTSYDEFPASGPRSQYKTDFLWKCLQNLGFLENL